MPADCSVDRSACGTSPRPSRCLVSARTRATDPTAATLAGLDAVHARLAMDFPEWNGRVEVDYVSAQAVQAVVQGTDESHLMIRTSPGEPLHEVEASRHYVLNWAAAIQADQPIAGVAPSTVLPAIDRRLIHQVVLQHVRAWPESVHDTRRPARRPTPCSHFAALRKRWRPDGWCLSWRPPMPAGHGSRNGPRSSSVPKTGGTTADRT